MKWVNQFHYGYDELPFGGVKQSGYGKEHGMEGLDYYLEDISRRHRGARVAMAVELTSEGAIGFITLDKPPANSYDYDFMVELGEAIDTAAADDVLKVVIVRSASKKFFCAGADIKAFLANDTAGNMKMINQGHEALASIARIPKVFIAQIEGHALGGGLEISLACDLRFGARGTYKLGVPEVTLGLLPGNGGTQRLPRIIGVPKALDLMVTGRADQPRRGAQPRHPQPALPGGRDRGQDARVRREAGRRRDRRDRRDQARPPTRAARCRSPTRSPASARASSGCSPPPTPRRA